MYLPMDLIDGVELTLWFLGWTLCCLCAGVLYESHKRGIF